MLKNLSVMIGVVLVSVCSAVANAYAPEGPYLFIGGGGAWLEGGTLKSTAITRTDIDMFTHHYDISYRQGNAFDYTGRAAFGYLFALDCTHSQALGFEAGYNYFGPNQNHVGNHIFIPVANVSYPVTTSEKTDSWATDLEAVYARDIVSIPRTSLILKLGMGYENMTGKITNTMIGVANQFPGTRTINNDGVGIAGGIGLQYAFAKHVAARLEVDGLKGGGNVGYAQGLLGLAITF